MLAILQATICLSIHKFYYFHAEIITIYADSTLKYKGVRDFRLVENMKPNS